LGVRANVLPGLFSRIVIVEIATGRSRTTGMVGRVEIGVVADQQERLTYLRQNRGRFMDCRCRKRTETKEPCCKIKHLPDGRRRLHRLTLIGRLIERTAWSFTTT